jgi:hypothetical protein
MRQARAAYHRAIRHANKHRDDIVNERFAEAIVLNNSRDFWQEVKRMRHPNAACWDNVDECSSPEAIANLFASKYEELYSCVSYNTGEISVLNADLDKELVSAYFNSADFIITASEVRDAIGKLKPNRRDGYLELTTNHFIHAPDSLCVHVAFLFSTMLVHALPPDDMLFSTVIPIPKNNNVDRSASENYRGITLSSVLGKIFDLITIHRFRDRLVTSDLQFGFRPKRGTDMCTMLLKEIISYYLSNDSSIYCIMLDATKAFDRVNYCKLFRELMMRNLPATFTRLMLNMYCSHFTRVTWNGSYSNFFKVYNGVKQGAIISPVLFCIYIDGLLRRLEDSRTGCYMGQFFAGALAYADDLTLIAPTPRSMRRLLALSTEYASEFDIIFNGAKSKCLYFTSAKRNILNVGPNPVFTVSGKPIEYVDFYPHLGHILTSKLDDTLDILSRRNKMCGQINNVLCFFSKCADTTKAKLMASYCYNLYGSTLWDLGNPNIESICCTWRKGLRRAFNLPYDASSKLLPGLSSTLPIMDELCKRTLGLIQRCLQSDCPVIRYVTEHGVFCQRMSSPVGSNAFVCCKNFGTTLDNICNIDARMISRYVYLQRSSTVKRSLNLIRELLQVRSKQLSLSLS